MKLEKHLEQSIVAYCKASGLVTYKFSSPSQRGVPDRIIIGPAGTLFLELKREGKKPTKLQDHHIGKIRAVGGNANWADNLLDAVDLINEVCT